MPPHEVLEDEREEFLKIYSAARKNDGDKLHEFVNEQGMDINVRFTNSNTALIWSARLGQLDAIQLLIDTGADVNATNKFGASALHEVAERGHAEGFVSTLLAHGTDCDRQDNDGNTPAMLAARNGHLEVLKELAEFGAQAEEEEEAPAAAAEEAPATITRTGSSCDLELKNQAGYTALMWAVVQGHVKVVDELLRQGASIVSTDNSGVGILSLAMYTGQENVVKTLFNSVVSNASSTVELSKATQQIMQLLGQQDQAGNTAFMWAVRGADQHSGGEDAAQLRKEQALECIRFVSTFGGGDGLAEMLDVGNNEGDTCLIWAASMNQLEIAQLLVESGASKGHFNQHNMAADFIASELGFTEMAELCAS